VTPSAGEMSDFDSNPFADPDLNNPFKDPSVTQVTRNVPPGLDEYNPFSDSRTPPPGTVKMPNVPSTQPAIMKPTEEHPAYTQIAKEHALAQAELLKRQEELERKAAELDRREREMQNLSQHGRKNNWPPLPGNFPVGPCFYQDFSVDIPVEFQKTVKIMYYLWMCEYKINCIFNRVYVLLSKVNTLFGIQILRIVSQIGFLV